MTDSKSAGASGEGLALTAVEASGPARATWREIVLVRAMKIAYDAQEMEMGEGPRSSIGDSVAMASSAAIEKPRTPWHRVRMWWTGANIERAWRNIHAAEEVLYEHIRDEDLRPRVAGIYAYARSYLGEEDLRVVQKPSSSEDIAGQRSSRRSGESVLA